MWMGNINIQPINKAKKIGIQILTTGLLQHNIRWFDATSQKNYGHGKTTEFSWGEFVRNVDGIIYHRNMWSNENKDIT